MQPNVFYLSSYVSYFLINLIILSFMESSKAYHILFNNALNKTAFNDTDFFLKLAFHLPSSTLATEDKFSKYIT